MAGADSLVRALDYVEAGLGGDIDAGGMAAAACVSPFHFSRLFSRAFLVGPWEWIVRRRLAEAARALMAKSTDVTEAAYSFGFSGPDVFARGMRRAYGVLPSDLLRGVAPRRPLLFPPSADVVSLCADAKRAPSVGVSVLAARRLRGEVLLSAFPLSDAHDAWLVDAVKAVAAQAGTGDALIVMGRGSFGQVSLGVVSEGGMGSGNLEVQLPGGRWLACSIPDRSDLPTARAWFRSVALSVLPVFAEREPEVIGLEPSPALGCRIIAKVVD